MIRFRWPFYWEKRAYRSAPAYAPPASLWQPDDLTPLRRAYGEGWPPPVVGTFIPPEERVL